MIQNIANVSNTIFQYWAASYVNRKSWIQTPNFLGAIFNYLIPYVTSQYRPFAVIVQITWDNVAVGQKQNFIFVSIHYRVWWINCNILLKEKKAAMSWLVPDCSFLISISSLVSSKTCSDSLAFEKSILVTSSLRLLWSVSISKLWEREVCMYLAPFYFHLILYSFPFELLKVCSFKPFFKVFEIINCTHICKKYSEYWNNILQTE